ncbi:MAG: asparagine synthetase B, partial [Ruminococcus sp.]|nr:asparagine synthetase B [Ruminococcus sp.]
MPTILNYQGHIRNWKNLCDELGIDKSLSREQRELEIIENGYAKWGKSIADHLYGMFAFAVRENDRIFAVRDHFGTVPFYYYVTADKKLLCSPSIRDIMEQDGFVKELNVDMLQIYMTLTYVAGEDTFFKGVKKLMPGHLLEFADGRLEIERYWKPDFKPDYSKSLDEWADEIHTTLQQIIPEVLEDDEKAESFLSGGVDSSYVLAMTRAERADSCGYEDERFDESPLAEKTAELLGVKFARSIIQPEDYFSIVPYVMYNMEQPLGDASAIVFALGCKAVDEKICFSGEGSDEFFGGYNMYRNAERYGDNLKTFYVGNTNIMKEDEKQRILKHYNPDILPINLVKYIYNETEGLDPLTKMSDVDIQIWLE